MNALSPKLLKLLLAIPTHVTPVAYLCLGYVSDFGDKPELESKGWRRRLALDELISAERWAGSGEDALKKLIRSA